MSSFVLGEYCLVSNSEIDSVIETLRINGHKAPRNASISCNCLLYNGSEIVPFNDGRLKFHDSNKYPLIELSLEEFLTKAL